MTIEPARSQVGHAQARSQRNPYEGRWNWWYSSIADIMIRDPSVRMGDIATELGRAPNTISMIVNTDLFQEYLARRKEEWRKTHDFSIMAKMTEVAELALDSVAEQFKKKKDQIPLPIAVEAMTSALDRLGYGTKQQPAVSVQVNQDNSNRSQTVVVQGVSATALEEARAALRVAEGKRGEEFDSQLRNPAALAARDQAYGLSRSPPPPLIEHETGASPAPAIPGSSKDDETLDLFAFTEHNSNSNKEK